MGGPGWGRRRRGCGGPGLFLIALTGVLTTLVGTAGAATRATATTAPRSARVVQRLVRSYQRHVSARRTHAVCLHTPSCSAYAVEAVERHGTLRGLRLTAARLRRCRPGRATGADPVPR